MTTMQQAKQPDQPPHVIIGDWRDDEWFAAVYKVEAHQLLTDEELFLLYNHPTGPRQHPYGPDAWCCEAIDRKKMIPTVVVFPTEEARDAWLAIPRN